MATPAQIEANRLNAQKSTGPKTEEGKLASSVNNRKHGFRGAFFFAPAEDAEEFYQIHRNYTEEFEPQTESERNLVQMLCENFWLRKRAQMKQMAAESQLETNFAQACKLVEMFAKYEAKHERAFQKCYKELQAIKAARKKEEIGFERNQRIERDAIRKEMLAEYKLSIAEQQLANLKSASNSSQSLCLADM